MGTSVELIPYVFVLSIGQLIALILYGYRIVTFINKMEFRVELMWEDYEYRMRLYKNMRTEAYKESEDKSTRHNLNHSLSQKEKQ